MVEHPPHGRSQFDRDLALVVVSAEVDGTVRINGTFHDRWYIDRAIHGGHVIAALVRAAEAAADDRDRALRSITVHYVRPAKAAPFQVEVRMDRIGRTLTNATLRLLQDGDVTATALVALGGPWDSPTWDFTQMPKVAPPEDCPNLWGAGRGFTNLHDQWTYRRAIGPDFMSGELFANPPIVSGGWMLLKEPRPVDAAMAAGLVDTWIPLVFTQVDAEHRVMFPTVDLTVHLLDSLPLVDEDPNEPCLVWHRIDESRDGFAVQDTEVWTRSGRLIARGRQHGLVIRAR